MIIDEMARHARCTHRCACPPADPPAYPPPCGHCFRSILPGIDLQKMEAELGVALAALDAGVRSRLEELVKPEELDPFEVRALGKFGVTDAMDILER